MLNIITTQNGFIFLDKEYILDGFYEIVSYSQCHIGTDKGIVLLDLNCTIDGNEYTDINLFVQRLKGE